MKRVLAIDIGGTKLAVGVVSDEGRLIKRLSQPTPKLGDSDVVFAALAELLDDFTPFEQYLCCGIGCGGPMRDRGELVSPLNIPAWRSFPLLQRCRDLTGLPCALDNDAKALALAEGWVGAAVGVSNYMAMVVSTGVGGGIILNDRLLEGADGNAGHIGHVRVAWPGREMESHVPGLLETEASGTAIATHTGRPAVEAGTAVIADTGRLVGSAVASVVNLLDLKLVVVAGSVALGYGEPFFVAAQAEIDQMCRLEFSQGAKIVPAGCGDEGPLLGAAAVGMRALGVSIGSIKAAEN